MNRERLSKHKLDGELRLTSKSWANKLSIKFLDYDGFESMDYFNNVLVKLEDFATRAACSTVEKPSNNSRRDANKLKKTLNYGF